MLLLERERSKRIDAVIENALADKQLIGAVVSIARDGELVYERAEGYADRETGKPMQPDSIFRLTSLSKTIVSAAALALVERKLISLDDAVTKWLPEFHPRLAEGITPAITISHLLTHTAGFHYGFLEAPNGPYRKVSISDGWDAVPPEGLSMKEQLARIAIVPLSFVPGSQWQYSVAIDILGEVLARATGISLIDVVKDTVTGPLHLKDTGFEVSDPGRLATAYADAIPPRRMADPDYVSFRESEISFSPSRIFRSNAFHSGGGGMVGTASDYLVFLEAIRNGGGVILSRHASHSMMTNQIGELRLATEPTPSWGFGFGGAILLNPEQAKLPQSAGTWKWSGLYGHHWFVDPEQRLTVVALSNTAVAGMTGPYVDELLGAVYST